MSHDLGYYFPLLTLLCGFFTRVVIEVDFSIELIPRAALPSKAPYRMSTLDLVELKM